MMCIYVNVFRIFVIMCSEYIILINISKGIRNVNFVLLCWYVVNCGKYFTYISFICLGNSDDIK